MKKVPQRTCVGCNEIKDKNKLVRIVKNKDNRILIGDKEEGRGIYICKNIECLNKVIRNKKIEKKFEIKIDDEFYESLRGVIIGK